MLKLLMKLLPDKWQAWIQTHSTKLYWIKEVITVIALIVLLIFIVKSFFPKKIAVEPPKIELQPLSTYKSTDGTHAVIKQQEVSKEQIKAIVDFLNLALKGKGAITTITEYVYKTDTVFKRVPVQIDSDEFVIVKKDDYIDLAIKGNVRTKEADIALKSYDTIVSTQRTIKRLFRPDEYIVDIRNKNPYSFIKEGQSFTIRERKPIISLGAGVIYNPFAQQMQYGVGIYVPLMSIKTK